MKRLLFSLLILGIIPSFCLGAESDLTNRDQAFAFIKKNMVGRRLETSRSRTMNNETLYSEFQRITRFANLVSTDTGFTFDVIITIKQKLWDMDGEKKIEPARVKDREVVGRYHISQRKSTGELLGFHQILSNSLADSIGNANGTRIFLKDGILTLENTTVQYSDHFAKEDTYTPGSAITTAEYEVDDNGKLKSKFTERVFDVNPKDLSRTPKGDPIEMIEKEIE